MRTINQVSAALQAAGIPLELVKGKGYFYWVTVDPAPYNTESEMVYSFNQLTPQQWFIRGTECMAYIHGWEFMLKNYPQIGKLMRDGYTVYYATVNGEYVECLNLETLISKLN